MSKVIRVGKGKTRHIGYPEQDVLRPEALRQTLCGSWGHLVEDDGTLRPCATCRSVSVDREGRPWMNRKNARSRSALEDAYARIAQLEAELEELRAEYEPPPHGPLLTTFDLIARSVSAPAAELTRETLGDPHLRTPGDVPADQ